VGNRSFCRSSTDRTPGPRFTSGALCTAWSRPHRSELGPSAPPADPPTCVGWCPLELHPLGSSSPSVQRGQVTLLLPDRAVSRHDVWAVGTIREPGSDLRDHEPGGDALGRLVVDPGSSAACGRVPRIVGLGDLALPPMTRGPSAPPPMRSPPPTPGSSATGTAPDGRRSPTRSSGRARTTSPASAPRPRTPHGSSVRTAGAPDSRSHSSGTELPGQPIRSLRCVATRGSCPVWSRCHRTMGGRLVRPGIRHPDGSNRVSSRNPADRGSRANGRSLDSSRWRPGGELEVCFLRERPE